jgi:DNA processing protein
MTTLLNALNLAYNTTLKAKQRLELAKTPTLQGLPAPCESVLSWFELSEAWLAWGPNRFWISIRDEHYPPSLLDLNDPPLILFGQGQAHLLQTRGIGMVGSRNATQAGLGIAKNMAKALVMQGWSVISGLAEGIDGAAHAGALEGSGATIAVLGCGLDHVYPKHHMALSKQIAQEGLLLSEYPPGTAPQPGFFPRRNRIIAALSDGLLVVEAALRSGSLITARVASTLGRPVFAVPGSIHSPQSRGCHAMIKQGAGLVETVDDILQEVQAGLAPHKQASDPTSSKNVEEEQHLSTSPTFDETTQKLLSCLSHTPSTVDHLAQTADLSSENTLAILTELELEGIVLCEAGQRWALV